MTDFDSEAYLNTLCEQSDDQIDIGLAALALIAPEHKGLPIDRYIKHFKDIAEEAGAYYGMLIEQGADDDAGVRLAALKYAIVECFEYSVDPPEYEILESHDIMRTIDRRCGSAAALALLYGDAAHRNGWVVNILKFPKRSFCRLDHGAERLIFDPAQPTSILGAPELRGILKETLGEAAELSNDYFDVLSVREMIIQLGNSLKHRRIEMGEYRKALDIIERLQRANPEEYRLFLDAGVLYAKTKETEKAIQALNLYINTAPDAHDRQEAQILLQELLNSDLS